MSHQEHYAMSGRADRWAALVLVAGVAQLALGWALSPPKWWALRQLNAMPDTLADFGGDDE